MRATERGFTLVELLVVIAIIGFLASTVLASLSEVQAQARDARRIQDLKSIIYALEMYYSKNKHYPCAPLRNSTQSDFLEELVEGNYLSKMPVDPINSGGYIYFYSSFQATPGGDCGQYVMLNYDRETESTQCLYGGKFVSDTHCHIPYPEPLPCDDPWEEVGGGTRTPSCEAIADNY